MQSEHKSSICRKIDSDYVVAVHFKDEKHDISTLRFCGIEKVSMPPRGDDLDLFLNKT